MKKLGVNFIFIFFLIMGLVFSGIGVGVIITGRQFVSRADKVSATIVDIEKYRTDDDYVEYDVYVDYEYQGEAYTDVLLNSYSSGMYEGKTITVLVDPEDPYHVDTQLGAVILGAIFAGIGMIFVLIGGIALLVRTRHKKKIVRLREEGRCLQATVESIDFNMYVTVNGAHPWIILCSYYDDSKDLTYRFKSDNLWTDPSAVYPVGSTVLVYVDAQDYSKYYVDAERNINARVVDFT